LTIAAIPWLLDSYSTVRWLSAYGRAKTRPMPDGIGTSGSGTTKKERSRR